MFFNDLLGSEIILPGLSDLQNGEPYTIGALLIVITDTRLNEAGLDFKKYHLASDSELILYARLQSEREDAYSYYNALLNRFNSFCNALESCCKYNPSNTALEQSSQGLQ